MIFSRPSRTDAASAHTRAIGRWLAVLAVFCQVVLGATVIDMPAAYARLAVAGLCRVGGGPSPHHAPAHPADCALCPAAAALHAPAPLPAPPAAVPPPRWRALPRASWFAARAPPPWAVATPRARAPPEAG